MFSHRASVSEKSHPLVEAESTNAFKRDQADPRGGTHPCIGSTTAGYDLQLRIPIPQAAAAQPREGLLCTCPLSLSPAPVKNHQARGTCAQPWDGSLLVFIHKKDE